MVLQRSEFVTIACLIVATLMSVGCDRAVHRQPTETVFRIAATDTGFEAPEAVPIGMRHIIFENHGSKIHEAMLVKLPTGMSAANFQEQVRRGILFPKGALDYSGPGLMSPGETVEMWVKVDPGEYVLICWNHSKSGSVHAFSVRSPIVEDSPPSANVVLRLMDYRFEFEGKLHKGEQVIRVETRGPSMHEADIFRLHAGKTVADVRRWRKEDLQVAPADALGGPVDSHDIGRVVWLRRNFTAGRYVLHCGMPITTTPETTGHQTTHADLGMVQEFEITD